MVLEEKMQIFNLKTPNSISRGANAFAFDQQGKSSGQIELAAVHRSL
jgi:hypothetical protein